MNAVAWARVWARAQGDAAARRALPVWAGVAIVGGVIFGGTGLGAGDVTRMARGEPGAGAALALMWLAMIAPAGAAMRAPAGAAWLRALPAPRAARWGVTAAIALAAQAPWALLWWLGAGPAWGIAAAAAAAAAMLALGALRWPLPSGTPRWRGPTIALCGVHARALVRGRGAAIARGLTWAACGGAGAGMIVRANELDGEGARAAVLAATALALGLGLGGVAAPVAESDRAAAWIAAAAPRGARVAAQAIVLALAGALGGVVVAAAAAAMGGATIGGAAMIGAALGAIGLGAGLGAAATRVGAWATAGAAPDGTRAVIGMTGAALGALVAVGALGAWAIAVVAAAAAALVAPLASPRGRG